MNTDVTIGDTRIAVAIDNGHVVVNVADRIIFHATKEEFALGLGQLAAFCMSDLPDTFCLEDASSGGQWTFKAYRNEVRIDAGDGRVCRLLGSNEDWTRAAYFFASLVKG